MISDFKKKSYIDNPITDRGNKIFKMLLLFSCVSFTVFLSKYRLIMMETIVKELVMKWRIEYDIEIFCSKIFSPGYKLSDHHQWKQDIKEGFENLMTCFFQIKEAGGFYGPDTGDEMCFKLNSNCNGYKAGNKPCKYRISYSKAFCGCIL